MHDLQVFSYEGSPVRTVEKDGNPWFVAADVCGYFGLTNSRNVVARLDDDEKGVCIVDTLGGPQQMTIVSESGLYHMLFTMEPDNARGISGTEIEKRKEKLKAFKRWVTHEVIPSIRKHGVYAVDEVLKDPDILISALQALKREREEKERLALESAVQKQQIAEMHPKVSYYDTVLACPDLVTITHIAKDYGGSAKWLNKVLKEKKIQFKQGDTWFLYQKYAECGYTQSHTYTYEGVHSEHAKMHTLWTQKGRLFIYDLLKADGILPVCEQE